MTLIEATTSGSRRRCDARCYTAHTARCECICGGTNHGKGFDQAVENTRRLAQAVVEQVVDESYAWRCLAYREDGRVCGRKAVLVDKDAGYPVCALHAGR